mgnify:CR=1 FL=1
MVTISGGLTVLERRAIFRSEVSTMYECAICLCLNHASRLHCQNCGTIPAKYSLLGVPTAITESNDMIEAVAAFGAVRACQHHSSRVYLRTMPLDYYGE